MTTPNELIAAFIDGLPTSVRVLVSAEILLLITPEALRGADAESLVQRALATARPSDPFEAARMAILIAAVIDFTLSRDQAAIRRGAEINAERHPDNPLIRVHALRMPLTERQFSQARRDWEMLRAADLSLAALHEFQATRLDGLAPD